MWRKGLVLLAVTLVLGAAIVTLDLAEMAERAAGMVVPALAMTTANHAHYLHVIKDGRSWNPFEAMRGR